RSDKLREALGKGNDEEARPLLASVDRSLNQTVHPDFSIVVDKHGDVTASSGCPIDTLEGRSMRLFVDLKQGMLVKNSILDHRGRAYLVAGTPVSRDPDIVGSEIVGSILIGVRLERLFGDFKTQTDDDSKQVELALVRNSQVSASAAESSKWDDIARAT